MLQVIPYNVSVAGPVPPAATTLSVGHAYVESAASSNGSDASAPLKYGVLGQGYNIFEGEGRGQQGVQGAGRCRECAAGGLPLAVQPELALLLSAPLTLSLHHHCRAGFPLSWGLSNLDPGFTQNWVFDLRRGAEVVSNLDGLDGACQVRSLRGRGTETLRLKHRGGRGRGGARTVPQLCTRVLLLLPLLQSQFSTSAYYSTSTFSSSSSAQ